MKSILSYIGSFSITGLGVSQMVNFNPFTLSFWATLTGIFIYAFCVGLFLDIVQKDILKYSKTLIKKWTGGRARLKD